MHLYEGVPRREFFDPERAPSGWLVACTNHRMNAPDMTEQALAVPAGDRPVQIIFFDFVEGVGRVKYHQTL